MVLRRTDMTPTRRSISAPPHVGRAPTHQRLALTAALAAGAGLTLAPRPAEACGGFFCANVPVVQTGEQIVFSMDRPSGAVHATINIAYQGAAQDFAWVLPLQSAPTKLEPGSTALFAALDAETRPTFSFSEVTTEGICSDNRAGLATFASAGGVAEDANASSPPAAPTVLQRAAVGPYDTVVLAGADAEGVRRWLVDAGYAVTDAMMESVVPYLAKGDVLVALKLQKDNDVGDIQPIAITMQGDELCVPIRLTAIAAQDDMEITTHVLSNEGRAIPENYFHVQPNFARLDWLNGGSNYRQLIAAAADEAQGNAFTTEYAGPTAPLAGRVWSADRFDLRPFRAAASARAFVEAGMTSAFRGRREFPGVVLRHANADDLRREGVDTQDFTRCPNCWLTQLERVRIDAAAAADELDTRIVQPDRRAQGELDAFRTLTRLYTLLSPEEMNVDPTFVFDARLPEVSNRHTAKLVLECGVGGAPGSAGARLTLEDGRELAFDSSGTPDRSVVDAMPAAAKIEQLKEGRLVTDNTRAISDAIDLNNRRTLGCGCDAAGQSTGLDLAALGLVGVGLLRRTRRRR
jgi:MYXO-CTERM domain-containing protein